MALFKNKKKHGAPPVFNELASPANRDNWHSYVGEIMRPNDSVLASLGWNFQNYEKLMRDEQVKAAWQQRVEAVVSAPWHVIPGGPKEQDKAAANFLHSQLERIGFDALSRKMLCAIFYGYAVGECLWKAEDDKVQLSDIKVRKADRFVFDRHSNLRLVTAKEPLGKTLPPQKFWVFTTQGSHDDVPYGLGLAHYLYWPVFLKRNALRFWSIALEKFGVPTAKGSYPTGASREDIKKLLDTLQAISTETAVAVPQGVEISLLESSQRSGGDHKNFTTYMDAMITKVILSQVATTEMGPWKGTAEVQKSVRDEIIKSDADALCESFNKGPCLWLTSWNFPNAAPPKIARKVHNPEDDLTRRLNRDRLIADMGFVPNRDYIEATYGGQWTPQSKLKGEKTDN